MPPALAAWILAKITRGEERLSILTDFSEIYKELTIEKGSLKAKKWYRIQVLRSIPMFIINHLFWRVVMFKNYVKIAFRNIKRHKGFSLINSAGLAIGISCCILILQYIRHECSFDKFHENSKYIYRVLQHQKGNIYHYSEVLTKVILKLT